MQDDLHSVRLANFISQARFADLPPEVVSKAIDHTLDTLGAALAGSTSGEAGIARATLASVDAGGEAICWGTRQRLSVRNAAMVNGIAAHAFELDDTGGCDHSGAVVLPAVIALLALDQRPVTGKDLLTAIVVGYDIGRRVLEAFGGYRPHNEAGWHSTGTCGVFGAAAAAANLLHLNATQTVACLGIAGSFSSGLWGFVHDGAMTKRIHAGRAAEGGVLAALFARGGMTGPTKVFEDVWGGFLSTYGTGVIDRNALVQSMGKDWRIMNCAIKPYASCRDTHAAVDAVDRLLRRYDLQASDIVAVHARLNTFLAGMVGGQDVSTMPAAQMSLPYAVSARICFGQAGLASYSPERRSSPAIGDMLKRIVIDVDESVTASFESDVSILTADNRLLKEPTTVARGAPANPLSQPELLEKFRSLAPYAIGERDTERLAEILLGLDRLDDARKLLPMLAPL